MRLTAHSDTRFHASRKAPKPPVTNEDEESQNERKRRGFCQKIDTTGVLTIFLGPPILLLGVTFLALFWWVSMKAIGGGEPEVYWSRIINADWSVRLVTICTTTIRAVVAFQAGLATAMIAGIVLETKGIPLLHGPLYSILRAVKVAPSSLFTATDFRPHLPPCLYALVIVEVLVTAASQFLSTIYLSDFANGTFVQRNNNTNVSLLDTGFESATGWWSMPPAASWTFGELSEPFKEGPNFHDTGHAFRAILPFDDETQRTKLRSFRGPVPVMDHRVVCAGPPLVDIKVDVSDDSDTRFSGRIPTENLSYPLSLDTPVHMNFTCKVPYPFYNTDNTYGESSICLPSRTVSLNWTVISEDPLIQPDGYPLGSIIIIVVDVVSESGLFNAIVSSSQDYVVRSKGPWTMVDYKPGHEMLRVSACITNMASETVIVGMNSSSDNVEPKLSWDRETQSYNTEASRRQLGASRTRESLASRGVLTLEPRSQWGEVLSLKDTLSDTPEDDDMRPFFMAVDTCLPTVLMASNGNETFSPGALLSIDGPQFYLGNAHLTHVSMFQDTLNTTESPALAMQALIARIYQMEYYEQLVKLTNTAVTTTAFSFTAAMPTQWTGFIVGTALIAVHFIIVTTVAVQFLRRTESSFIGNYWQTISQVVSNETQPILEQADRMDDGEVKHWAKKNLHNLKGRRVLQSLHDGRIALDVAGTSSKS